MTDKIANKLLSLDQLFNETTKSSKKTLINQLINVVFIILLVILWTLVLLLIYQLLLNAKAIDYSNFIRYRFIFGMIAYIGYFIIGILAQILLINALFNQQNKFFINLSAIKKFFIKFFLLTLAINIILLISTIPIYTAIFLFFMAKTFYGFVSLLLAFILLLISASYLIYAPFILVEKDCAVFTALEKSYRLAKGNIDNTLLKLILLALGILVIEIVSNYLNFIPYLGLVLSFLIFILLIIFAFNYLFVMYQDIKKLKNV